MDKNFLDALTELEREAYFKKTLSLRLNAVELAYGNYPNVRILNGVVRMVKCSF